MDREILSRIKKECFPDMEIMEDDILKMAKSSDYQLKKKLFERIMYNSTDRLRTLKELFDIETLRKLLHEFKPAYNEKYMKKMTLLLRNLILNEDVKVETLEWRKR